MCRVSILFALILFAQLSLGQRLVQIADRGSQAPIPFAHINSPDAEFGFVANAHGAIVFEEPLDPNVLMIITCVGYHSDTITGKEVNSQDTLFLASAITTLSEVVVLPMPALSYLLTAIEAVDDNYVQFPYKSSLTYREQMTENKAFLSSTKAFLAAQNSGYGDTASKFSVYIKAARELEELDDLNFMLKEREKDFKKEKRKASRKGEPLEDDDFYVKMELGDPLMMLQADPLRKPHVSPMVNDDNIDFLDSNNFEDYEYWYGAPVYDGKRTIVVVEFDQRKGVRRCLLAGSVWIDQATHAIVKIDLGLSPKGIKHIVPGYLDAALWLYGVDYQLLSSNITYRYRAMDSKWLLSECSMTGKLRLEKRRFFESNEVSMFDYQCEMLCREVEKGYLSPESDWKRFDQEQLLSDQLVDCSDEEWRQLSASGQTIR